MGGSAANVANPDRAEGRRRLRIIPPGAKVGLRAAGIADAVVLTVQIRAGGYVTYECAWFNEGDRLTAWVEEFEIDPDPPEQMTVGFRKPE